MISFKSKPMRQKVSAIWTRSATGWIGRSAGDAKTNAAPPRESTSSKGLLDPPTRANLEPTASLQVVRKDQPPQDSREYNRLSSTTARPSRRRANDDRNSLSATALG